MKKTILCWIGLFFLTLMMCIFNPPNNDNNNPNDTIIGWEKAGINSTGENSQHVNVCRYGTHLFTFNYRGELFHCIYPELIWTQMNIPNSHKVYDFYCDTINGLLYVSSIECSVYEYSIISDSWRSLVPKHDIWYDSTKLYQGNILSFHLYDVVCHKNLIFIMTIQRWGTSDQPMFNISIWRSNRDTLWEHADSGWAKNVNYTPTITDFYSIDDYLYASTFEDGLWRYDGVSWMAIPGTRVGDVNDLIVNGGDPYSIPGFRPRSMVKHNNDIFVGNLGGMVHKMLSGFQWERRSSFFLDYNANKIFDHWSKTMSLYTYNGYLIDATYYYSESDTLWLNMTPMFKAFDTTKNNALPGYVYGMTNIGDTLFVAVGDDNGKYSGVYFLDLKKCKWYQKYK